MYSGRIENIHSLRKLKKDLTAFKSLSKLLKFLAFLKVIDKRVLKDVERLNEIDAQFHEFYQLPDRFNQHFSKLGWIAYESMNTEIVKNTIKLADKGKLDEAEEELLKYYAPENLRIQINWFKRLEEFKIRFELIRIAYQEYINGNYYTCVPLQLMIIDGVVNDIDKNKGFHAKDVDLEAWDSIAAHSSGLKALKELFTKTRRKTTQEEIKIPYRNGILHGKDLVYGNIYVAAKGWAAMFAIRDWAIAVKEGKRNPTPDEAEKSLKENWDELIESLERYQQFKQDNESLRQRLANWKPREISQLDLGKNFEKGSPEEKISEFMESWIKNNYGKIASFISYLNKKNMPINLIAGKYRMLLSDKKLLTYKILSIKDQSPAISEVNAAIEIEYNGKFIKKDLNFRLIFEDEEGSPLMRGEANGNWKIIEGSWSIDSFLIF